MDANSSFLQIGDRICLYSEVGEGFLTSTGLNHSNFYVQKSGKKKLALVPNQRHMVFQLYPKLNYNITRDYDKLRQKLTQTDPKDFKEVKKIRNLLQIQEQRKINEQINNQNITMNQRGDQILYGMTVQLRHEASGQFLQLSKKSAEEDKTCQKLEITSSPVASRVSFQIFPRYKYRQEGDCVVFNDQILLFNQKYNAYVHFSKDLERVRIPEFKFQSDFRPASPLRRRNPENLFHWFEANVSQNFEKWTIMCYRKNENQAEEDHFLYGGDVIRIKHAESGGYLTVSDFPNQQGLVEAYIRNYLNQEDNDLNALTSNQMFEIEKSPQDSMEKSGFPLMWYENEDSGSQLCNVRLRHFLSGRLLQVTLYKDDKTMNQILTLAKSGQDGELEQDGEGISSKKILKIGGRIQNYEFQLANRATVDESTLSKETVANIANQATGTYISSEADFMKDDAEEESVEETSEGGRRNLSDFEDADDILVLEPTQDEGASIVKSPTRGAKSNVVTHGSSSRGAESLGTSGFEDDIMEEEEEEKDQNDLEIDLQANKIYRPIKHNHQAESIRISKLEIKNKASMNDVFVPIKCNQNEIHTVLYIQSAVPKIKTFLFYIRERVMDKMNLPFFIGIQELLKSMIFFILDEKNTLLDPMACDGTPSKLIQNALRECRFIDLIIDCLIYPFQSRIYKYEDLTQQHPITKICLLIYRLLKHSVTDNFQNKNYVAQWIDLFFTQAMICTDQNSFMAEVAITELLKDNVRLLENQIEKVTIENMVSLCLAQPLHERFMDLLVELCSCNDRAIASNQDFIFETMLENEENREKLFFPIQSEGYGKHKQHYVMVRDDSQQGNKIQKIAIESMFNFYQEKGDMRLYNYFQALIRLSAAICFQRNYKSILALEKIYNIDAVIDVVLSDKIDSKMRACFSNLLHNLHLDKDPLEKLVVPIMTRVWQDIEEGQLQIPVSTPQIHPKLLELKPAINDFIRQMQGILKAYDTDFNSFLLQILKIIETMIGLGFYESERELIEVTKPLIQILNGCFDFYSEEELQNYSNQVEKTGDASIPLKRKPEMNNVRYKQNKENDSIMKIKDKIIDICKLLMEFQNNTRLTRVLIQFNEYISQQQNGSEIDKYCNLYLRAMGSGNFKKFESQLRPYQHIQDQICQQINSWVQNAYSDKNLDLQTVSIQDSLDFSCILLDVIMYENPKLVSNCFQLLISLYSQKLKTYELASEVQILQEEQEIATLNACNLTLTEMKKDAENSEFWLGRSDNASLKMARSFIDRLTALTNLCIYEENRVLDLGKKKQEHGEQEEEFEFLNLSEFVQQWDDEDMQVCKPDTTPDGQNQRLLSNLRAHEIALQIIGEKTLRNAQNQNAYLKVVEKAYSFLIMFVKDNNENSNIILKHIETFLDDLEYGVHALELIKEVFSDNENLMEYPLVPLIRRLASAIDHIDIESTKKATLISFIPEFMQYRGEYIRPNQYLILSEFTSSARRNSNYLFVGEKGMLELQTQMAEMKAQYQQIMQNPSLLPEVEIPPEMSYTIAYMNLIAYSGMGKNVQCETRAQALLPIKDLVKGIQTAEFCFPLKSAYLLFLHQIYLDIEKEIGEDFVNQVWKLIAQLENDLLKFVEVMQRQRRQAGNQNRQRMVNTTTGSELGDMLKGISLDEDNILSAIDQVNQVQVDVSSNFDFVTNFGRFKVSELLTEYVFNYIFPVLQQFCALRLPMKQNHREILRKLFKLCLKSNIYKSKPIHDKNFYSFVNEIRNNPNLTEFSSMLGGLGLNDNQDDQKTSKKLQYLSPEAKLKVFMTTCRTDDGRKKLVAKEFEELVKQIIDIDKRTEIAFKGANTIINAEFIKSLISSTDITSSIPSELRTNSLLILRKIIESENKQNDVGGGSAHWDTEDWVSFAPQIQERQTMLNNLGIVPLLCRIITKETKRAILEEAILVAIAVLLGGNNQSQTLFHEYILQDVDNGFLIKVNDLIVESFEIIKKKAIKRNTKTAKIQILELQMEDLNEDEEEYQKLLEQMKIDEELIKDTEYIEDEERVGETVTISRAIDNLLVLLRFLQLLCENHNLNLQKVLNFQTNVDGRHKLKQINIVMQLARMFEQYIKVINNITIDIGQQLVDCITECIQGPCKENQITLVLSKILDSSREFISNFDGKNNAKVLGFVPPEDDEDDDLLEVLDEFITKIATLLTSLLEGEEDLEILSRMNFALHIDDLKNRMLNVFGNFLIKLDIFPIKDWDSSDKNLSTLSKENNGNVLNNVSVNKVTSRLVNTSFDGNIYEAFEIYFLLQNLADGIASAKNNLHRDRFTQDQFKAFDFIRYHTGRIEVSYNGNLQRVYFPIRPVCNLVSNGKKKSLMLSVNRESQQTKVTGLMESVPSLTDEMDQNYKLQNAPIKITPQLLLNLKDFSTVVGTIISSVQLFALTRTNHYKDREVPDFVQKAITILGIVQGVSSGVLIGFYIINKFEIVTKSKWRQFLHQTQQVHKTLPNENRYSVEEMSIEKTHLILICHGPTAPEFNIDRSRGPNFGNWFTKMEYNMLNLYFFLSDRTFQYFILYFGISMLGFLSDELFYSLHLLDVVIRFESLTDVVRAVTLNTNKLLSTGLLAMVIIYIFTTISFFYLQDTLYDYQVNAFDSDYVGENMCESMFQCYMTIIDKGLTLGGGIGDYTESINYRDEIDKYYVKLAHDASFHILVKVILLNILFGIIIDTFAKMREQKKFIEMDKNNVCFICNYDRFIFDKSSEGGFDRHVSKDHNLWYYVYYIVHLENKDTTEMTGIESYVFDMYQAEDISWIPRNNALCLQVSDDAGEDDELEKLRQQMKAYSEKLDEFNARLNQITIQATKQKAN